MSWNSIWAHFNRMSDDRDCQNIGSSHSAGHLSQNQNISLFLDQFVFPNIVHFSFKHLKCVYANSLNVKFVSVHLSSSNRSACGGGGHRYLLHKSHTHAVWLILSESVMHFVCHISSDDVFCTFLSPDETKPKPKYVLHWSFFLMFIAMCSYVNTAHHQYSWLTIILQIHAKYHCSKDSWRRESGLWCEFEFELHHFLESLQSICNGILASCLYYIEFCKPAL